ncbi:MAG: hypothetical protein Q7R76_00650 [Candidatus Woesearchaeota archaeon]|nr:hypothetical protein [Candidatus Woesearchaeota archaeon]
MNMSRQRIGLFLVLVPLLLSGCLKLYQHNGTSVYQTKDNATNIDVNKPLNFGSLNTFEDMFGAIVLIDDKYGISFKQEALFGLMADEKLIPHIKRDLEDLRKKIDPVSSITPELVFALAPDSRTPQQLGALLVDARMKMIESQEKFHLAYASGVQGLVGDGFYCREQPVLFASIDALNQSAKTAATAKYYLDELLTGNTNPAVPFVGVGDQKPVFYYSPNELIWDQLKVNKAIINEYCNTDLHNKAGKSRDSIFVNFDQSKHKDLFINPSSIVFPSQWKLLTEPVRSAKLKAASAAPASS